MATMIRSVLLLLIFAGFSQAQNEGAKFKNFYKNLTYQTEESQFFKLLMNGYNSDKRPDYGQKQPVAATLTLHIHHLSIPEIPNPTVRFNSVVKLKWRDARLGWNPADVGGKMTALVPQGIPIWVPPICSLSKGYSVKTPIHTFRTMRSHLKVSDPNMYQMATIESTFRYDGAFDCNVTGSFPSEVFNCALQLVGQQPISEMTLQARELMLKKFDFDDLIVPSVNGWNIANVTQKIRYYTVMSNIRVKDELASDDYPFLIRHLIEIRLELRRDGWSLPIVVLTPFLVTIVLVTMSWVAPIRWACPICLMCIYILSVIVRDSIEQFNIYHDDYRGIDLGVLNVWFLCCFSLVTHTLMTYYPRHARSPAPYLTVIFKRIPLYQTMQNNALMKQKEGDVPFEVIYLRNILGFLAFMSMMSTFEY